MSTDRDSANPVDEGLLANLRGYYEGDAPETVWIAAGNYPKTLHISEDCHYVAKADNPREVAVETLVPDWCETCGWCWPEGVEL